MILSHAAGPPLVVQNLRNVTLVNVGDSYQFTVIIESHPSPGSFKWMLNGAKIVNGTANFRVANPTHNSDRSTYSLMIMNIRYNKDVYYTVLLISIIL